VTTPAPKRPRFDHISLGVSDLARAMNFWDGALAALGWTRLWTQPHAAGYAPEGFEGEAPLALLEQAGAVRPEPGLHLALAAPDRAAVRAFHAAALAGGGVDDGAPGVREHYDPGYFAAFAVDPDGHRVEAVVHERVVEPTPDEALSEDVLARVRAARAAPGDAALQTDAAYACDGAGHEVLAAGFYDSAWALGVPEGSRRAFQICYASTLRNVGRLEEAEQLLSRHLERHPGDLEARCFRALTRLSAGEPDDAVAELLDVALELRGEPSSAGFWPALASYRDELTSRRPVGEDEEA
jgi:catechol 2,3-dioxygenase-like lactoylglutathione lyase family enzyme